MIATTLSVVLIAALFDLDDAAAKKFVVAATEINRPSDKRWGAELPETEAQEAATRAANSRVRMRAQRGR